LHTIDYSQLGLEYLLEALLRDKVFAMLVLAEIDRIDQSDTQNRPNWAAQVLEHFSSCLNHLNQLVDSLPQTGRAEFALILKAATAQDCIVLTQQLGELQDIQLATYPYQAPLRFTARIGAALVPTGNRSSVTG
jgi:GGDEF domain-containing protein